MFKTTTQYYKEEIENINTEIMVEDMMFQNGLTQENEYKNRLNNLSTELDLLERLAKNPESFIISGVAA